MLWSELQPSACALACNVEDFALTPAERRLFQALEERGVRFLVIGLSAAVLEGAPVATQDIDLWLEKIDDRVAQATLPLFRHSKQPSLLGLNWARTDSVLVRANHSRY